MWIQILGGTIIYANYLRIYFHGFPFVQRLTYTEAVDILKNHKDMFELEPPQASVCICYELKTLNECFYSYVDKLQWGEDLKSEHEQFIVCHLGNKPVFVVDYPVSLKPFYARPVDGDSTVVRLSIFLPQLAHLTLHIYH